MAGTQLQPRNYTVVEPCCNWSREKECDTLVVNVSGFKKDQLRVLINTRRKLNIRGERHIDGNHWSRLNKEFRVSKNMNIRGVHATFDKDQELLCVVLPKFASQINKPQEGEATQVGKNPPSKAVAKMDSSRGGQALASKASHGVNLEGRGGGAVPVMMVGKDMRNGGEEDFPRRSEVYVDRVVGKMTTSEGSGGLFISMCLRKNRAWVVLVVIPFLLLIIGFGASVLL